MFRKNEDKLENIIFAETNSNDIEIYIAKYNVNPEVFKELTLSEQTAYLPELQKMYFTGGDIVVEYICIEFITTVTTYGNCPYPGGVHSNGQTCSGESVSYSTSFCSVVVSGGGGDNGGGGGYPGGYNNSGNTGGNVGGGAHGGGSGTGSNGVSTSPIGLSINQLLMKDFVKNLTDEHKDWYVQNQNTHQTIQEYLEENNFSEESEEFIENMINLELSNSPIIVGPNNPIDNMIEYLECFDLMQGAQITIYADQPVANTNWAISSNGNVGHSFITIKQGVNIMTFGFYPAVGTGFTGNVPGVMNNDQSHTYDVSLTMNINATTLQNIILHSIESSVENYNLNNNNCTDFILEISGILGLSIPDCYSSWGLGGGSNPGKFGQFIRTMTLPSGVTRNISGGNAPANHKSC